MQSNQDGVEDGVYYLLADHLGGTAITLDVEGDKVAELRYAAWGETRFTGGDTPTQRRYTGQIEAEAGLYFYQARWYDPALGRFAQADTVIPEPGNVLAWDRYAYVNNSPVSFNDPSGHCPLCMTAVIGAAVGAIVGAVGYTGYAAISGQQFNTWHMLLAAGGGAVAGALIGTGVGWAAGIGAAEATTAAVTTVGAAQVANTTCGGDMCADETQKAGQFVQGALPSIENAVVNAGDDVVNLYRAVSRGELKDIVQNQIFRPNPTGSSMDAKWFWETVDSARAFANKFPEMNNIVQATVPKQVIEYASQRWANLDQIGPAVSFIDEGLDIFNKAIISIRQLMQ